MKSIRIHAVGEPEVLTLEDVADPIPGPGQVVVKLLAAGVNPVETYIRAGKYPVKVPFPYTPGTDAAGVVEGVGAGVTKFKPGDRVYTAGAIGGTYAEKVLADQKTVHRLPQQASFAQGAALGVPYATAYQALFNRAAGKAGETVLVHGASGGVGIAAVQLARAAGFTVIGTASTEAGRALVQTSGAHYVLDHSTDAHLKQVMDLTSGRGVDVILEMAAHVNLAKDLPLLAKFGRVVVIGSRGDITITPRDTMGRDADIRGMTLFNATEQQYAGIHAAIIAGLENRTLAPVIWREIPLADAPQAHRDVMQSGALGKIVLIP